MICEKIRENLINEFETYSVDIVSNNVTVKGQKKHEKNLIQTTKIWSKSGADYYAGKCPRI